MSIASIEGRISALSEGHEQAAKIHADLVAMTKTVLAEKERLRKRIEVAEVELDAARKRAAEDDADAPGAEPGAEPKKRRQLEPTPE